MEDCQGLLYGAITPAATEVGFCRAIASFERAVVHQALSEAGTEVVGYYRIRAAATLQLSDEELALAEACFSDPGSVALLISREKRDAEANFFFREKGKYLNFPLLSFRLDAAGLGMAAAPDREQEENATSPPEHEAVAGAGRKRRRAAAGVALAGGILLMTAAGTTIYRYVPRQGAVVDLPAVAQPAVATPAPALPLRAERQGRDLKIAWDSGSPGIATAMTGILDISDGDVNRRIVLATAQIRFGTVVYSPVSDQVSVSLTAVQADGSAFAGSVLVVLGNSGAAGNGAQAAPPPRPPTQATRPFLPPPAGKRGSDAAASEEMPAAKLPEQAGVMLPPVAIAAPAGGAERTGAEAQSYTPPVLVSGAGVRTPPVLRGFEKRPVTVRVRTVIDEAGRVVSAKAEPQDQIHVAYLQAAEAAAQRCRFRPARREGAAVRGEVTLNFRFAPDQ